MKLLKIVFDGDKDGYKNSLLCSGNNAAGNNDVVTHFGGKCPPKTENVQKAIIKQLDNFGKKIEKEAKKLFDFNHKFCVINFSFTEDDVPYHSVDFSSAGTMASTMQIVEATWKNEIKRQLEAKGGKCTNFITKNQTGVKKIIKWNQDLVKKVKLNGNNFEKKMTTMLGKEITKAKKDAAKAAKGK